MKVMQFSGQPIPPTTLRKKQEPSSPEQPDGFSNRLTEASRNYGRVAYPVAGVLLGGQVGAAVASHIALGLNPALTSVTGVSVLGGVAGVAAGYFAGRYVAKNFQQMSQDASRDSKVGGAILSTAVAGSLGAVLVGSFTGMQAPGMLAAFAGTTAGLCAYAAVSRN